ncbi:MAG: DUF3574 domain-containing protein [Syntrophobacteraceae bacterium]|nr:DUF3574 domain-containing protein [Desulfobacteraceae bacterium]
MRHLSAQRRIDALLQGVVLFSLFAFLLGGCATLSCDHCRKGESALVSDTLYFGTEWPGGRVSAAQWRRFLEAVATPLFPDGFTTWEAAGQWREPDGRIVRENSYVLQIIHPDDAAQEEAVQALILDYKKTFQQKSVLRVRTPACASF